MIIKPLCLLQTRYKSSTEALQMLQSRLSCGFPSPADDYFEQMPSLNELLIKHPSATYLARASGESMIERGIMDGSLIIVDRSVEPFHDATIVASIAGELTIKILDFKHRVLKPANKSQLPIPIPDDLDVICEGTVTYCVTPQHNYAFAC